MNLKIHKLTPAQANGMRIVLVRAAVEALPLVRSDINITKFLKAADEYIAARTSEDKRADPSNLMRQARIVSGGELVIQVRNCGLMR